MVCFYNLCERKKKTAIFCLKCDPQSSLIINCLAILHWENYISFPFKFNGIWSWWQFSFRFGTKLNYIWQIGTQVPPIALTPKSTNWVNPLMPNGAFNICCPTDCVSRHNGGASGAPLKPLRVDSALSTIEPECQTNW